ncbi:winged helix-turn-helix transcriptional regulator [Hymenobacter elongatus]|uniref:Transcriptional regulator n=1 Tax=Hymenobacter elongatus TaxID=877208 RepID=A0A4Z0PKA4_9BACT|nr:helix-turn-helix domain-containing protein [Hymenobacter elongatus]TGE16098.1 transcriptional regulator [Hymenobacter elongatus]
MLNAKKEFVCPTTAALDVLGGKWKIFILMLLKDQTLRFGELQKRIPKVTQKMLTQQLRELEEAGLLHRQVFAVIPPRVEYRLTEHGQTLKPVLESLHMWGILHREARGQAPLAPSDDSCGMVAGSGTPAAPVLAVAS